MTSISVLLADDHPVVRDGYRCLLEGTDDITVIAEAMDGETTLSLYSERRPDVVVLDLNMPGIGGLATIERLLRKDDNARILVFSTHDSQEIIQRTIQAGAKGFLIKSSDVNQLVEAIRQVARGRTYIDPTCVMDLAANQIRKNNDPLSILTPREFEIFRLLADGMTTAQIALTISISSKTVGVHHANIMRKLNLENGAQLVRLAIRSRIIDL
jgi:two-component system invasion response regulator UvrY